MTESPSAATGPKAVLLGTLAANVLLVLLGLIFLMAGSNEAATCTGNGFCLLPHTADAAVMQATCEAASADCVFKPVGLAAGRRAIIKCRAPSDRTKTQLLKDSMILCLVSLSALWLRSARAMARRPAARRTWMA